MKPLFFFAAGLGVVNAAATAFAAVAGEPWHAAIHVGLTAAFGAWAARIKRSPASGPGVETLETELSDVQRELLETREDLDFAERMLAEKLEAERIEQRRRDDG
jgi:Skp family chaperone for outer membrane proteins